VRMQTIENTQWPHRLERDGSLSSGTAKNISGYQIRLELEFESISKLKLVVLLFITIEVNIIILVTLNAGWMIMNKEGLNWLGIGIKGIMLLCESFRQSAKRLLISSVAYIDEKVTSGDH